MIHLVQCSKETSTRFGEKQVGSAHRLQKGAQRFHGTTSSICAFPIPAQLGPAVSQALEPVWSVPRVNRVTSIREPSETQKIVGGRDSRAVTPWAVTQGTVGSDTGHHGQ